MPERYPSIIKDFQGLLYGGDYNPEQWLKEKKTVWQEDMRLLKKAGVNCLSVGIFSWAMLEPEEGRYDFAWMDEVMDMLHANGIMADLATPSAARPRWLAEKYPEVLRVREDRRRELFRVRHNLCMTSPVAREKIAQLDEMLARRYAQHPALKMWHINNEVSGYCHCPICQARFREWCRERYGTLDNMNDAWWSCFWSHQYTSWDQLESPSSLGDSNMHGLNLAWRRFETDMHIEFLEIEKQALKRHTPDIPVTANLMAGYREIDYGKYARHLDVVSWDNYPAWRSDDAKNTDEAAKVAFCHDLMYGLKQKPFLLMESTPSQVNWHSVCRLHRPGVLQLQSAQAVAHGADSVMYFQMRKGRGSSEKFHGAVIGHDGTDDTRTFREVAALGRTLQNDWAGVTGAGKDAKAALVYDYECDWALSDIEGGLRRDNNYRGTVESHYRALWELGVTTDIIDQNASPEGYSLVILPMGYMLREGFSERLKGFVRGGGTVVATYMTGMVNEEDLCFRGGFPGPLRELFGLWAEELDALYPEEENTIRWNGKNYRAYGLCEVLRLQGARALGEYEKDYYAHTPAVTENVYGKGRAVYIAARTGTDFLRDFYAALCTERSIPMPGAGLPEGVSVQSRTDGKTTYSFYMNFTNREQFLKLPGGENILLAPYDSRMITV